MGNCCCCCCPKQQRVRARVQQEEVEQEAARKTVAKFCDEEPAIKLKYSLAQKGKPKNIGGRLQKHWFVLNERSSDAESELTATTYDAQKKAMLTLSPVSVRSPIKTFDEKTKQILNAIIHKVKEHPCVLPIEGIWHIEEGNHLVTVQKLMERSLRDYLCEEYPYERKRKRANSFLISWSEKYKDARTLEQKKIVSIGRQVLEAMKFLYKSGFPVLGHIHSGNIFVEEDEDGHIHCFLGGYETLLLGYRTRLYRTISEAQLLHRIDIIMFGHVMFEMATGTSLEGALPSQDEYEDVKDEEIRKILKIIFDKEGTVKKLLKDEFFKGAHVPSGISETKVTLSGEEKTLLKLVAEPYNSDQPIKEGKSLGELFKEAFSRHRRHRPGTPSNLTQPLLQK